MAEKDKSPYETLLEEIDNLKKENTELRKDFNELRDFNRALLSRGKDTNNKSNNSELEEKFKKYLQGE